MGRPSGGRSSRGSAARQQPIPSLYRLLESRLQISDHLRRMQADSTARSGQLPTKQKAGFSLQTSPTLHADTAYADTAYAGAFSIRGAPERRTPNMNGRTRPARRAVPSGFSRTVVPFLRFDIWSESHKRQQTPCTLLDWRFSSLFASRLAFCRRPQVLPKWEVLPPWR